MTLDQATMQENSKTSGNQDLHLKAAQHLDMASKSHADTAKQLEGGDQQAATRHAQKAAEHLANANEQIKQLNTQGSSTQGSSTQGSNAQGSNPQRPNQQGSSPAFNQQQAKK
jgi:hypothetical protein